MNTPIRITIADDHPIVRHGLRQIIERDPALQVVAEADNGLEAPERIEKLQPQVALLDLDMPHMHGFDVARKVRSRGLAVEIIFLTVHREEDFFNEALSLGAKGYVLKDSAITDIVTAIKAVAASEHFVSPVLTSLLVNRNFNRNRPLVPRVPGLDDLTPTERRVLGCWPTTRPAARSPRRSASVTAPSKRTARTSARSSTCKATTR